MHTGLFVHLKIVVPLFIYVVSLVLALRAMSGKMEWTLAFLIAILPLRNVIDKLQIFPLGKDMTDLLFLALLVGMIIKGISNKGEKIFEKSPLNSILIIIVLYKFVSLLQGSDYLRQYSMFSLSDPRVQIWKNFCTLPLLFFVTFNGIKDQKWVWKIIVVMCVTMVFMDFYLVRQISWFSSLVSREKIKGTFVYLGPNETAAFYNQYTIMLMGLYFFMKKGLPKMALLGLIITNVFCVLFLFSRAAYIAIFIGMFFLFAAKRKVLLIPLILIAIFWHTALPEKVRQRIEMTTNEYGELDKSSANRLTVWQYSIDMFNESPITGVGFGVFSQMGFSLSDTHNIYLKILAEEGLIGIILFLLLIFILFIQGIRLFLGGEDDLSKGLGLGYTVGILVMMINNVFGDRWTYTMLSSNLWVFTALVARLNFIADQSRMQKKPKIRKTNSSG